MKRIVSHNTVLGVDDKTFSLIKGEFLDVYERDKYNKVRVMIQGEEVYINNVMLEGVSNPADGSGSGVGV